MGAIFIIFGRAPTTLNTLNRSADCVCILLASLFCSRTTAELDPLDEMRELSSHHLMAVCLARVLTWQPLPAPLLTSSIVQCSPQLQFQQHKNLARYLQRIATAPKKNLCPDTTPVKHPSLLLRKQLHIRDERISQSCAIWMLHLARHQTSFANRQSQSLIL